MPREQAVLKDPTTSAASQEEVEVQVEEVSQSGDTLFALYCACVALVGIGIRWFFAQGIHGSGMFSDDYGQLKKSIFYPLGDFAMGGTGVDPQHQWAGAMYAFSIIPWQWFEGVDTRHQVLFFINSLLAAGTAFFGALIIRELSGKRSLLAPICLMSFPPLFLYTFYALTENLFHFLAVATAWYVMRAYQRSLSARDFFTLCMLCVFAPLTRTPGLAVAGGVSVAVLLNFRMHKLRALFASAFVSVLSAASYFGMSKYVGSQLNTSREGLYVSELNKWFDTPEDLLTLAELAFNQTYYVLITCGFFPFALLLMFACKPGALKSFFAHKPKAVFQNYALTCGALLLFFCLVHLIIKLHLDPNAADFIYGRYNDTTALLVLIGGLAALTSLKIEHSWRVVLGAAASLVLLYFAVERTPGWNGHTINQSGWFMFSKAHFPEWLSLAAVVLGSLVLVLPLRIGASIAMLCMLYFNVRTIEPGLANARRRGGGIAYSLQVADWVQENLPKDACIEVDRSVRSERAPGAIKRVSNVYRALSFAVYPREIRQVGNFSKAGSCDYFFTLASQALPAEVAWINKDYTLYRISR